LNSDENVVLFKDFMKQMWSLKEVMLIDGQSIVGTLS
jgi:hypothetical protein